MKSITPLYLVAAMAIFPVSLKASDLASRSEGNDQQSLLTSCQALRENPAIGNGSDACRYYIYGFVDAAQATDGMHAETLKESENQRLSFTERAYRTRVGKVEGRSQATQLSYFCVPQGEVRQQLITKLSTHMKSSIDTPEQLKTAVYSALTAAYPCR